MKQTIFNQYIKIQKELGFSTVYVDNSTIESGISSESLEIKNCKDCKELVYPTPVPGFGNSNTKLMFIVLAPAQNTNKPFTGDTEDLFIKIIENGLQIPYSSIYVTSLQKCPSTSTNYTNSIQNCKKFIDAEIEKIKPEYICCLGRECGQSFLQLPKETTLNSMRKKLHWYFGREILVTHYPGDLLNHIPWKKELWEDLKLLIQAMK